MSVFHEAGSDRGIHFAMAIVLAAAASPVLSCNQSGPDPAPPSPSSVPVSQAVRLFDPDPNHLWNRTYAALNTWNAIDKTDPLFTADPLHWPARGDLLTGASQSSAIHLLTEFQETGGEKLVRDPLQRIVFQHALWLVFDWAVETGNKALLAPLAEVMKRIAPTAEEIRTLPDAYGQAVASRALPPAFDPRHPDDPFLPPDLLDPNGPWVLLGDGRNSGRDPLARAHLAFFGARSSFLLFLRLPEGRERTLELVRHLQDHLRTGGSVVPGFPRGTHLALLRRMMAVTPDGSLVQVPVVESLQLRVIGEFEGGVQIPGVYQRFFKLELKRADLLSGQGGGITTPGPKDEEPAFITLMGTGTSAQPERALSLISPARNCFTCHLAAGSNGVALEGYARSMSKDFPRPDLVATTSASEEGRIIAWKTRQSSWDKLKSLWK